MSIELVIRKIIVAVSLLTVLAAVCACNEQQVAGPVDQRQSNEIVAFLSSNGIAASVEQGRRGKDFSIYVKRSDYFAAAGLLAREGYPREAEPTFADLIAQKGLVPNSREIEALRLDRARSVQVQEILENHAAVISAKVALSLDSAVNPDNLGVSVVIQKKAGLPLDQTEVKSLVHGVLPGITAEQIVVSIAEMEPALVSGDTQGAINVSGKVVHIPLVPFLWWRVPEGDRSGIMFFLFSALGLMGFVGIIVGIIIAYFRSTRELFWGEAGEQNGASMLKLDKDRNDLLGV